ncbi:MAG: GNAT family N-acetyltransferase [Flavobacteriales bacterium]
MKYETERLLLKPTNENDAEFIFELMNTPKWKRYIGERNIYTVQTALAYIKDKMLPQNKTFGFGNYTVVRKSDGVKIGSCGLYNRDGLEGVDIGFAFLPQFEGKGYGYESSMQIMKLAEFEFKLTQVSGITNQDNYSSQNLLVKIGLKKVGLIKLPHDDDELMLFRKVF